MLGWAVFGGLVLVGFLFGVVAGYESAKPVVVERVAKATPDPPEPTPKKGQPVQPVPAVKKTDSPPQKPEPMKGDSPKVDPPRTDPVDAPPPPKKVEPKSPTLSPVSFQREVLPILRTHCLNCHGAGTGKPKADVNLTSIASMKRSPGKILVPGKPEESDVYTSITEREMPDGGRPKPTPKELATLRNWILTGAKERRRIVRQRLSPR
jgi:hypothetical protein